MTRLILAAAGGLAQALAHNAKVIRQHVPEDLTALPAFPAGLE